MTINTAGWPQWATWTFFACWIIGLVQVVFWVIEIISMGYW